MLQQQPCYLGKLFQVMDMELGLRSMILTTMMMMMMMMMMMRMIPLETQNGQKRREMGKMMVNWPKS
eukprot:3526364-Amphidinium_carterae.1